MQTSGFSSACSRRLRSANSPATRCAPYQLAKFGNFIFCGIHNSYRRKLGGIRTSSALMLEFEIAHALDKLLDADEDWRRSGLLAGIPPKEGHS